jgi:methionyl aminopeptidase
MVTPKRIPLPSVRQKLVRQKMTRTTRRKMGMLLRRPVQAEVRTYTSGFMFDMPISQALGILTYNPRIAAAKKKKRKSKKKKKGGAKVQSSPPRVPVSNLFPNNQYPEGEIVAYKNENSYRTTNEEKRYLDRMNNDFLQEYRQAAEVHRQVRQYAQKTIKPGQTLTEIAEGIEDAVRALTGHQGLEEGDNLRGGMGFPCGLSINHCAAHYTPNAGNKMVLQQGDVMKVDFGAHINGRIVDSAFTMTFDPVYDPLLEAVKDATNTGIRVRQIAGFKLSRISY